MDFKYSIRWDVLYNQRYFGLEPLKETLLRIIRNAVIGGYTFYIKEAFSSVHLLKWGKGN